MTSARPRFANPRAVVLAGGFAVTLAIAGIVRADQPSTPRLLPKSTVAYVSIPDVPEMTERFMSTATGQMSQDPQLKPLLKDIYGSVAKLVDTLKDRVGLSLTELLAIPQGQITVALVAPDEADPALVLILDTGDHLSSAQGLLDRITDAASQSGIEITQETAHETTIQLFDGGGRNGNGDGASYFEKDGTIVAATKLDVLKQLLAVWNGEKGSTLADNRKFTTIMSRCGDPAQKPQLVWFIDPIEMIKALGRNNTGARVGLAMLPTLGLDGISALGGTSRMDVDEFDSMAHTHLLLEHPRSGVLKAIAFTTGDTTPERWVPADIATYMTVRPDLDKIYKTVEELFDSFQGDGALADSIEMRISGPLGIDVQQDLLAALTGRITYVNLIERPITVQSSANLIAFELKKDAQMDKVLEKLQAKFSNVLIEESYAGSPYYKISPPRLRKRRANAQPGEMVPPMPCVGIVDRSLIIADRQGLFKLVAVTAKESDGKLADALDFKLITAKIARQGKDASPVMVAFSRPEEALRFIYDLASGDQAKRFIGRQAKNNPVFKSLNSSLESHPLPPFAVLEQYLAPSGGLVMEDETGLHYIGFALKAGKK
jgi:hypothetical protein